MGEYAAFKLAMVFGITVATTFGSYELPKNWRVPTDLTPRELHIAHVVEGEAPVGNCPTEARVAVLYAMERNDVWYGWDPDPSPETLWLVRHYREFPDPTGGARYVVNDGDLGYGWRHDQTEAIRSFTIERGPPTWTAVCATSGLYGFPKREAVASD